MVRGHDVSLESDAGYVNRILFLYTAPLLARDAGGGLNAAKPTQYMRELRRVYDALKKLESTSDFSVDFDIHVATIHSVHRFLNERPSPLIIHFIGHIAAVSSSEAAMVLEDNDGIARELTSGTITRLLSTKSDPPCVLAFLNACHSEAFGHALINVGVSAVVCVDHSEPVLESAAAYFAEFFYQQLFSTGRIDESFEYARQALGTVPELQQQADPSSLLTAADSEARKFRLLTSDGYQDLLSIERAKPPGRVRYYMPGKGSIEQISKNWSLRGRQLEVHEIISRLRDDQSERIVALYGMGGIGKSILVFYVAIWQARHELWNDGVYAVDLRGVESCTQAVAKIIATLDLELSVPAVSQLANHVSKKRILLILDDLDSLIDHDPHALTDLLQNLTRDDYLRVLTTSRMSLPLALSCVQIDVKRVDSLTSQALFISFAGMKVPTEESDVFALKQVLQFLDGYPLALRVAASYLKALRLSVIDLVERFKQNPLSAMEDPTSPGQRDASVRVTLDLTYNSLSPESKSAFRHLAAFPSGLTDDAITEIFGTKSLKSFETLILFSMTEITVLSRSRRFTLPEPARVYGLEKPDSRDLRQVLHRACEYYIHSAKIEVEKYRRFPERQAPRLWFAIERANIGEIITGTLNHTEGLDVPRTGELLLTLEPFLSSVIESGDAKALSILETGISIARAAGNNDDAIRLTCLRECRMARGDVVERRAKLNSCLEQSKPLSVSIRAWVLNYIGQFELRSGNTLEGKVRVTEGIDLLLSESLFLTAGVFQNQLAEWYGSKEDNDAANARRYFRNAASSFESASAWAIAGASHSRLAKSYLKSGIQRSYISSLKSSLACYQKAGETEAVAAIKNEIVMARKPS